MSTEPATAGILSVQLDASLDKVAWLMANNRVHALIVVDDYYAAEPPVIAVADPVAAAASGHFDRLRARDVAGTEAVTVRADERLDRAAQTPRRARGHAPREAPACPLGNDVGGPLACPGCAHSCAALIRTSRSEWFSERAA